MKQLLLPFVVAATLAVAGAASAQADLSLTNTDAPDPVAAGSNVTYTITVTNNGPDPAVDTTLNGTLDANTRFVSLGSPGGYVCTTPAVGAVGAINCTNGAGLPVGPGGVFTLVASVPVATPAATVLTFAPTISSTTPDGTPANNTASATTTVSAAPVTVPTLSEWAMILFGLILAGAAAVYLERRRHA